MSSIGAEFCDTNVLVYAYDITATNKRAPARQLVQRLWRDERGVVSIQVLQELFVTLVRRLPQPGSFEVARAAVVDLSAWRVVEPERDDGLHAIDGSRRWQVSFWDAMILVCAKKAGAPIVWSEDLNDGQSYDGVVVRNPFA